MLKGYRLRDYDFKLVIMVLALSIIGYLAVGSAKESLQAKQLFGIGCGFFIMIILSLIDYKILLKLNWFMYIGNIVLLVLVQAIGKEAGGAQRWLQIGGFTFQPSETAKILLILFFAQFIMVHREHFNTFRIIATCVVLILIPWVLIVTQPDLSTSIVVLAVFCMMMFAGGLNYKVIFAILAVVIPAVAIFLSVILQMPEEVLEEYYMLRRILAFVDPQKYAVDEAYQQLNSVTAIASGMLNGKGYNNNEITSVINGNFVSEPQTDFIFTVIGEEFGFKGCLLVIVLIIGVAMECLAVGRKSSDTAGTIIGAGVGGLIAVQGFFNMGVATFILPNTGLPLPFVSYGLTSLLSLYIAMGFVLNVRLQARR